MSYPNFSQYQVAPLGEGLIDNEDLGSDQIQQLIAQAQRRNIPRQQIGISGGGGNVGFNPGSVPSFAGQGAFGYFGAIPWDQLSPEQRIQFATSRPGQGIVLSNMMQTQAANPQRQDSNYWDSMLEAIANNGKIKAANVPRGSGDPFGENGPSTAQALLGGEANVNTWQNSRTPEGNAAQGPEPIRDRGQLIAQRIAGLKQQYGNNWRDYGYDEEGMPIGSRG